MRARARISGRSGRDRERTERVGAQTLVHFPGARNHRLHVIGGLRRPRPPAEVIHLVAESLEREAWVSEETGRPVPLESLRAIAAWARRHCVPEQIT